MDTAQGYGTLPASGWPAALLAASPDIVLALDPTTTIVWCNESVRHLLGRPPEDIVGRSFAEFVHPDDLVRAAEVISLAGQGAFDTFPMTPALYRVRTGDDAEWMPVDVNASTGPDGSMLVTVRPGGDLVIVDRLLEAMSAGRPFDEQVGIILEFGRWRHPGEGYAIYVRGEDGERAVISCSVPDVLLDAASYDGLAPWEQVEQTGAEVVIDPLPEQVLGQPYVGCLAAHVRDPDHASGAVIAIWTSSKGPTTSGHRYAMANMARSLDLVLQQRAQVRRLERAAQVDQLTSVASRSRLLELLDERDGTVAILYVDLDGFKAINDARGHSAGDATLVAAAEALVAAAPDGSVVGRLGGDEFAVICPVGTDLAAAEAIADEVIAAFAAAEVGPLADVLASVGVAAGAGASTSSEVLHAADVALLAAKAAGRNRRASA